MLAIVQGLTDGDYSSDQKAGRLVAGFEAGVLDPSAADLIFWSDKHFDHEPAAAEIVDRALSYRPIEL